MKMSKLLPLIIFTATIASCSTSKPQSSAENVQNAGGASLAGTEAETDTNKLVCKKIVPTGSRLGTKVCKTVRDWEAIQRQGQDSLRRSTIKSGQQNRDPG